MSIQGSRQGRFMGDGSVRSRGFEWMPISNFVYGGSNVERDLATGQSSGKRQHEPINIVKEWGTSTPQLWSALVNNEKLTNVTFEFTKMNNAGSEYVYNTVKLTNANIVAARPHAIVYKGVIKQGHDLTFDYEECTEVGLAFHKIEVSHKWGKTMYSDDWSA